MKKLITNSVIAVFLYLGISGELFAQCTFTGLASSYCRTSPSVQLVPTYTGSTFTGSGVTGSVFTPSLAGGGTHTITQTCPGNYTVTSGTYNFLNVGGNIALNSGDDVITTNSLAIGFPFTYFCNTYNAFWACSNGWITFTQTNLTTYPGQNIPTNTTPYNLIAVCWTDLNLNISGGSVTYTTIGTSPTRTCVITYSNVAHYSGSGNQVTVQLQLHETTNIIEIHTMTMPTNNTNHTQGIQNSNSSVGFVVPGRNASSSWSATNDMYRFTPDANCVNTQTTYVDPTVLLVTGPSTVCLHSTATFTASGTATYTWNTTETSPVITVTPAATTVYNVTGVAPNSSGCVYNTTHTLTVFSTPVAASTNPALLCVGSTATLTGTGAATYTWSTSEQSNTILITPSVNTTYTLWGTSSLGCEEVTTITQNVNTNVLTISSNTSVCKGSPATLSVTGGNTYSWSTIPSSPFSIITVTPNSTQVYSVGATDANFCHLEAFVTVSVNPNPTVTLNTPKNKVCKGDKVVFTAGGGDTYQWSHGSSSGNTISVIPTVDLPLVVTVTATNQYGCKSNSQIQVTVDKCTGISEPYNEVSLVGIYPNPASGLFYMKKTNGTMVKARVFNSVGALIATIDLDQEVTVLNLTGYAAGVYFVEVSGKSGEKQLTRIVNE